MLLEFSNHRPHGSAAKMATPSNSCYFENYPNKYKKDEKVFRSYDKVASSLYENSESSKSVVQCYSVSTGKVSTLLRSPSQSSISSIEVAEINNLSEFTNNSKKGHQIRAIDSSSPSFVKYDPIGETNPALFSAISEVKVEEEVSNAEISSRKCAIINRLDDIQNR